MFIGDPKYDFEQAISANNKPKEKVFLISFLVPNFDEDLNVNRLVYAVNYDLAVEKLKQSYPLGFDFENLTIE